MTLRTIMSIKQVKDNLFKCLDIDNNAMDGTFGANADCKNTHGSFNACVQPSTRVTDGTEIGCTHGHM